MATTTTDHPYKYTDTEGAVLATTGQQYITMIAWVEDETSNKDIAADDDFLLSDSKGNRIIGKRAAFAGDDLGIVVGYPGLPVDGITVTALNGGVVYVWVA